MASASSFPRLGDENVEIRLTSDKDDNIMLYSYVLALHSKWFKASLSERWIGGNTATDDGKNRWVYELRFDKDSAFGLLARPDKGTDTTTSTTELISRKTPANASAPAKKLHKQRLVRTDAHRRMLEAMYHISPTLPKSFGDARASMLGLSEVAEAYDCLQVVTIHISNHLQVCRNDVLAECFARPIAMLERATAVKCDWIFVEASAHIIGRSKQDFASCEITLRSLGVWDLFREKRAAFRETLAACDLKLLALHSSYGDGSDQLATAIFRQWLTEQFENGRGSGLGHNYASVYHAVKQPRIDTSSENGLVARFLKKCSSQLGLVEVALALNRNFAKAGKLIEPILKDVTQYQVWKDTKLQDLTFMSVEEREVPWAQSK